MFNHEDQELKFACTKCDLKYKTKSLLNKHMETNHLPAKEFNCVHCSFQGSNQNELNNHLKISHHMSSKNIDAVDTGFTCHSCGLEFDSRWDLMNRRKTNHADVIKRCKFFLLGTCVYEDDVCWFRHSKKPEEVLNQTTVKKQKKS